MDQQQQTRWWRTRRHHLWICGVAAALVVSILIGYRYGIPLWDWIKLLVVPAMIAGGGIWFNRQQRERELEIADQRRHGDTLQAYLDQIGQLLLNKDRPLRQSKEGDEERIRARARTLSVLQRLDGLHKKSVVEFLQEACLIDTTNPMIDLAQANLWYAELYELNLSKANFSGVDLRQANLSQAELTGATLLDTNLSGAVLERAELSGALMSGVHLAHANLTGATGLIDDFHDEANDYLESVAHTLDNATMPNSQKYEDWLKSKGRGEDGHGRD